MHEDIQSIQKLAMQREITRLCHFTPARTLFKIAQGRIGILSAQQVCTDSADVYKPTDEMRYDGYTNHVCCSIQFPNTHYLNIVKTKDPIFRDWVVLLVKPDYLWQSGTKFCAVNAAKERGAYIGEGLVAFQELFKSKPHGSDFQRSNAHRRDCPSDMQAEVLVPDRIAISDIEGIAFPSPEAAREERARWQVGGIGSIPARFLVCPQFFDKNALRKVVRSGEQPVETLFEGT